MLTYIHLLLFVPAIVSGSHEASREPLEERTVFLANSNPLARRGAQGRQCTTSRTNAEFCAQCFGAGATLCPGSNYWCYYPSEVDGIRRCGGAPSVVPSARTSTIISISPPSPTIVRYGANCAAAFGSGYATCAAEPHCYNQARGDVCCSDGSYCNAGETCTSDGYCLSTVEGGAVATRLASGAALSPASGGPSTATLISTSSPSASSTSTFSYPTTSSPALVYPTPSLPTSSPTPSARYTGGASALAVSTSLLLSGIFTFGVANVLLTGML